MNYPQLFKDLLKRVSGFFKSEIYILTLILVLALFFRVYKLEYVPAGLYYDEVSAVYTPYLYQLELTELSIRNAITYLLSGTFFTYQIFGSSSFFARIPGVIFGTALVFVVYLLAKEMFSKKVGLTSALLMALIPWAVHFSRFLAICSAYVFYFTAAVLCFYKGVNSNDEWRKFIWLCFGSLLLGLTANILASSRVFVPLFIVGFISLFVPKPFKIKSLLPKALVCLSVFLAAYSPIFFDYLIQDPTYSRSLANSIFSHSRNIFEWIRMGLERAYMHISPGFLVFTIPATHDLPFQETLSQSLLLRYSPTIFGELNIYGVLLYPGIALLVYEAIKKRNRAYTILLWWIVSYLVTSGIGYYDNPNAARNIVGLPALVITIALCARFLLQKSQIFSSFKAIKPSSSKYLLSILMICLGVVPSGFFLHDYFVSYSVDSANVFDYGFSDVADYLSTHNLWGKDIYIHAGWGRDLTLSFYSPKQPPSSKIAVISNVSELDPANSLVQISKTTTFTYGIIKYETMIGNGYGVASSSHFSLFSDEENELTLAIYAKESTYEPNGFLLFQDAHDNRYFVQSSFNETIEYGEWYSVKLIISTTTVDFYFEEKSIISWSRPNGDTYQILKLFGESATVSFKNLTIQENEKSFDLFTTASLPDWENLSGKLQIEVDPYKNNVVTLLPESVNAVLVTHYLEDYNLLLDYSIPCKLLKSIYYPDSTLDFLIIELLT